MRSVRSLDSKFKTYGIVMGANVEALLMLFIAHKGGSWLNEQYPIEGSWLNYTYVAAIVMIGVSWVRMFRSLAKGLKSQDK